ncbi:MAG: antibiotic biosynthesis monooxygenase [Gemmatimonadota bacterium]
MISRIWNGWTSPENADEYERLLKEQIFPGIETKAVKGYRGIQLFRRPIQSGEIEFMTVMWFDSWDDVKAFAGEDFETAYVPQSARKVLARFDARSRHFEVRAKIDY